MIDGRVIRGVDMNAKAFQNSFARIKGDAAKQEVLRAIRELLGMNVDQPPARLHFHALKQVSVVSRIDSKKRVPVFTIHGTADDRLKVSFTWENGTAWLRLVDEHDVIDKNP